MDALNEVLRTLHLKGTVSCRSELSAPWGLRVPHFPGHAGFSVVARGSCWPEVDGEKKQIALAGGDFVMFPHGNTHVMRDGPGTRPVDIGTLLRSHSAAQKSLSYGGGGARTTLVCGCFEFEGGETNPLISALPAVIHIKGDEGQAVPWLETTLQYLASETASRLPGAETVIGHLADIIFIQAVRAYISSTGDCKKGLVRAMADPQIGQALALIHDAPQQPWTVASLALRVGMSRAGFAARFRGLVGEPPMQYLTRWRMHKAAGMLRSSAESLAEIAAQSGYEAEAAFSKAFKRWAGHAPGAFRQSTQMPALNLAG
jgi:AraC-like DNA-binding protein